GRRRSSGPAGGSSLAPFRSAFSFWFGWRPWSGSPMPATTSRRRSSGSFSGWASFRSSSSSGTSGPSSAHGRGAAAAVPWFWAKSGRTWEPAAEYPPRLGRWPAAGLLLAFAALELAYPRAAEPRPLALAIVVYSWITWAGMLLYGRQKWVENAEAFHVYFGLFALIAPFAVREENGRRVVVVRPPLAGVTAPQDTPGTIAFVAVMLGSVAFDGFSRTTWWQDRLYNLEARYIVDSPRTADLVATGFNGVGLIVGVIAVALLFRLAVRAAQAVAATREDL